MVKTQFSKMMKIRWFGLCHRAHIASTASSSTTNGTKDTDIERARGREKERVMENVLCILCQNNETIHTTQRVRVFLCAAPLATGPAQGVNISESTKCHLPANAFIVLSLILFSQRHFSQFKNRNSKIDFFDILFFFPIFILQQTNSIHFETFVLRFENPFDTFIDP